MAHILVLGGQRSGKSRFAESLILASGRKPVYLATAAAGDAEMKRRIEDHRARRNQAWTTIEEPLDLPARLLATTRGGNAVLVDCLTLWLSNLIEAGRDSALETDALLAALGQAGDPVVLVSNEVGSGIVPANALARRFADAQGVLNQRVAATVDTVVHMAAGIPTVLKPAPSPVIAL